MSRLKDRISNLERARGNGYVASRVLARLGVGGLPGAGMKLGLRDRGILILSA